MDYKKFFSQNIKDLKNDNNYRYFNNLKRIKGKFPICEHTDNNGNTKEVTIWCSNDYLGMGQNKIVVGNKIHDVTCI